MNLKDKMRLVEETEAHVLVRLLSLVLLLGLLGGSTGVTASGGTTSSAARGSSTTAGADVGQEVLDVLALKSLSRVLANVFLGISNSVRGW
jgi:hypothetical protein